MKALREYLHFVNNFAETHKKDLAWPHKSMEGFVLEYGQSFNVVPPPDGLRRGEMKECYYNALMAVLASDDLVYVEGYAFGIIPVLHAWVATRDLSEAYDLTWKDGEARAYLGVPMSREYVGLIAGKREKCAVIDAWDLGFPLLSGEHGPDEFLYKEGG